MKVTLAVIVAFVFMFIGWFFLVALLWGVMYTASHARDDIGLMHVMNILLIWFLSPGFGGFLATYVTSQIFKNLDAAIITTSFISVVVTLGVVVGLLFLPTVQQEGSGVGQFVLFVVQSIAIVVGARISKSMYMEQFA